MMKVRVWILWFDVEKVVGRVREPVAEGNDGGWSEDGVGDDDGGAVGDRG